MDRKHQAGRPQGKDATFLFAWLNTEFPDKVSDGKRQRLLGEVRMASVGKDGWSTSTIKGWRTSNRISDEKLGELLEMARASPPPWDSLVPLLENARGIKKALGTQPEGIATKALTSKDSSPASLTPIFRVSRQQPVAGTPRSRVWDAAKPNRLHGLLSEGSSETHSRADKARQGVSAQHLPWIFQALKEAQDGRMESYRWALTMMEGLVADIDRLCIENSPISGDPIGELAVAYQRLKALVLSMVEAPTDLNFIRIYLEQANKWREKCTLLDEMKLFEIDQDFRIWLERFAVSQRESGRIMQISADQPLKICRNQHDQLWLILTPEEFSQRFPDATLTREAS